MLNLIEVQNKVGRIMGIDLYAEVSLQDGVWQGMLFETVGADEYELDFEEVMSFRLRGTEAEVAAWIQADADAFAAQREAEIEAWMMAGREEEARGRRFLTHDEVTEF